MLKFGLSLDYSQPKIFFTKICSLQDALETLGFPFSSFPLVLIVLFFLVTWNKKVMENKY